jgi:hypothetical protein
MAQEEGRGFYTQFWTPTTRYNSAAGEKFGRIPLPPRAEHGQGAMAQRKNWPDCWSHHQRLEEVRRPQRAELGSGKAVASWSRMALDVRAKVGGDPGIHGSAHGNRRRRSCPRGSHLAAPERGPRAGLSDWSAGPHVSERIRRRSWPKLARFSAGQIEGWRLGFGPARAHVNGPGEVGRWAVVEGIWARNKGCGPDSEFLFSFIFFYSFSFLFQISIIQIKFKFQTELQIQK